MSRFVLLEQATWDDDAFKALSTHARLLFLWSWSNPHAAICGLYRTREVDLLDAFGSPDGKKLESALLELSAKPLLRAERIAVSSWEGPPFTEYVVWVVNRARYANRSPSVAKHMRREYERVPPCELKRKFASKYRGMLRSE